MEVEYPNQPGLIPSNADTNHAGLIPAQLPQSPVLSPKTYQPKAYEQSPFSDNYGTLNDGYGTSGEKLTVLARRVYGLMPITFWLLLALITIIIAAAVGGGVGGTMAVNNARTQCLASSSAAAAAAQPTTSPRSTTTTTTDPALTSISPESLGFSAGKTTTAWGPLQTSLPYTGCPDTNGSTYTSFFPNSKFRLYCGLDIPFTGTLGPAVRRHADL